VNAQYARVSMTAIAAPDEKTTIVVSVEANAP
jgi:hypothetical protein